jgi:DNA-binding transcriptional LysR family regulator
MIKVSSAVGKAAAVALAAKALGTPIHNNSLVPGSEAVAGHGLAYMSEVRVREHLRSGQLVALLEEWCPPFSDYHLYYPGRRQPPPAFRAVANALRYRAGKTTG